MKLQCPHCGVKGSAEDSYCGRKVKCPKCQGLFEVKPDMALEIPEKTTLLRELSPTSTESPFPLGEVEIPISTDEDSGDTGVDRSLPTEEAVELAEIDEDIAEPETKTEPPAEQEEQLDWEDIASEIDLQLTEGRTGEEHEDTLKDSPVDISSLQNESETLSDDLGLTLEEESGIGEASDADIWDEVEENPAEREVAGLMEESPLLDPVDSLSPEQETEDDLLEPDKNTENNEDDGSLDEVQLVEEADEIELEPYGIDKEQCWQCGKKGSLGEAFVEKDGRLYCNDCAPIEAPEEVAGTNENQDEGDTPYVQGLSAGALDLMDDASKGSTNRFAIGDAIRQAWAKTKGAKGAIWAGSAIMYLVILIIVAGGAFLLPSVGSDLTNISGLVSNILFQAVTNIFSVLFTAGLFFMGLRKVAGDSISWKMIFKGFSCAGKLIVAAILQFILVSIGFLLLVLPGIYLIVGYGMTLPLIVDKGLSPWQAMEMSRKAVHKIWWKVAGLFIVMGLIFVVSLLPLGIGLIWTWPMFIILAGVVYHYLFGDEKKVS